MRNKFYTEAAIVKAARKKYIDIQEIAMGVAESDPLGTFGDYTLRRQIGRGWMGIVYEAWQNSLGRQVALKVLPTGVAADPKAFEKIQIRWPHLPPRGVPGSPRSPNTSGR